jgi:uncharacterized cupin superfamily protein
LTPIPRNLNLLQPTKEAAMGKRIDSSTIEPIIGTTYPAPFDEPCRARQRKRLGDAAGLTQYGVNLLRLPPGAWSSQRHWHTEQDEFIFVVSGEVVLVSDGDDETLRAADAAGFKAGDKNGHCLQNRSGADAVVLEIGTRLKNDAADYPDIDMIAPAGGQPAQYCHKDGSPYTGLTRRGP